MNEEISLRELLLKKFDELPVQGNATDEWKKLKKILQLAMPAGLLAFAFPWKLWLTKKIFWGCLLGLGVGGATAVIIYKNRQAGKSKLVPVQQTQQPTPDVVNIYQDTIIPAKATDTSRTTTSANSHRKYKKSIPSPVAKDTTIRKRKTPPPVSKDTTVRRHKIPPTAR